MSTTSRTLALAGIFQAARLAQQLAREGRAQPRMYLASISSILKMDAPDAQAVFGGIAGAGCGLELLRDKLNPATGPKEVELARYVIGLVQLERRLHHQPAMLAGIRQGVLTAVQQMQFFNQDDATTTTPHPLLIEKLAALYSETISTLTPRIMVTGEHGHLSKPGTAAAVRASLLAGIRAAVLWRQLGGRRWQLLFLRGKIAAEAAALLDQADMAGG